MKNKLLIFISIFLLLLLTACTSKDAISFKKDYESINGKSNASGKVHRTVTIPKNNPIVISSAKEVLEKIENEDTFYVYFGSELCPWCRSVIEKAIEIANYNGIDEIYYVDIWDDDGKEILRDKYTLDNDGNPIKEIEGTDEYYKLLTHLDNVLEDYTYTKDDNKLSFGEKRIYAPNFIYIAKGKAIRMTTGISDKQSNSREELTAEILEDETKQFDDFFLNICDESC